MNNSQKSNRLFFAIWPTDQIRLSIDGAFSRCPQKNGRVMQIRNLHLTLHFLGQVVEPDRECMHLAAQSINAEQFQLDLDCLGHFARAKIFWMGAHNIPAQLSLLHEKLGDALADCGFKRDQRTYTPHVTLMRKCVDPVLGYEDFSVPWHVKEFVLVESVQGSAGVEYRVIETYPLL